MYDTEVSDEVDDDDAFLDTFIPDSANQPYDMHEIIEHLLDDGEFLEVHALFAPNIVVGFGRIEGHPVGVVANQPMQFAGCLDIDASEKAARFVRTCDAFNIPVLTLVDVPGFLPGVGQEHAGIIRRGAKLIYAYAEATVPKITVITRKAFGGAYDVMGSKHLGADINVAWPTAQIAVMGAQGAANILHRKEIAKADDPEAVRAQVVAEYEDTLVNPYVAAERGYIDSVIPPSQTRVVRDQVAADAAQQARDAAAEEAREHPAVSDARGANRGATVSDTPVAAGGPRRAADGGTRGTHRAGHGCRGSGDEAATAGARPLERPGTGIPPDGAARAWRMARRAAGEPLRRSSCAGDRGDRAPDAGSAYDDGQWDASIPETGSGSWRDPRTPSSRASGRAAGRPPRDNACNRAE